MESTGLVGSSGVVAYRRDDGAVLRQFALPPGRFGESVAADAAGAVFQTTYEDGEVYKLKAEDLSPLATLPIPGATRGAASLLQLQPVASGTGVSQRSLAELLPPPSVRFADEMFAAMTDSREGTEAGAGGAASVPAQQPGAAITEAWGLAFDAARNQFLLSDGTLVLHRLAGDFAEYAGSMLVTFPAELADAGKMCVPALTASLRLNELEYVPGSALRRAVAAAFADAAARGRVVPPCVSAAASSGCGGDEIWAAVYGCPHILRIDACTGVAVDWISFLPGSGGGSTLIEVSEGASLASPGSVGAALFRDDSSGGAESRIARVASHRRGGGGATAATAHDAGIAGRASALSSGSRRRSGDRLSLGLHESIYQQTRSRGDLNGIALCPAADGSPDAVLVTGKNWDALFEVPLWRLLGTRDVCSAGDVT